MERVRISFGILQKFGNAPIRRANPLGLLHGVLRGVYNLVFINKFPNVSRGARLNALPYKNINEMTSDYKKRIRLKHFEYKGCYRYFITICTHDKKNLFNDEKLVEWLVIILRGKSVSFGFKVWAYCFMPDHLHLLIEGNDDCSDMRKFLSSYKKHTGFYYKKENGNPLWQINYYEHVLRKAEDTIKIAQYIFHNPVRKGLVDDYRKYKFLGSFEIEMK
ncbi:MAG: transposase [Candidatus Kuenenia sp.]|nr:transposase [Candidatus Kuenenia hertensis]